MFEGFVVLVLSAVLGYVYRDKLAALLGPQEPDDPDDGGDMAVDK